MEQDTVYVLLPLFFFLIKKSVFFPLKVPRIFGISSVDRSSGCSAPGELEQVELSAVAN